MTERRPARYRRAPQGAGSWLARADRGAARAADMLLILVVLWIAVPRPLPSETSPLLAPTATPGVSARSCGAVRTRPHLRFVSGAGYVAGSVTVWGVRPECGGLTVAVTVTGPSEESLATGDSVLSATGETVVILDREVRASELRQVHVAVGRDG